MGTAGQISDSFVSDKVDLICAIATPSAQSAYNAAMDAENSGHLYSSYRSGWQQNLQTEDGNPVRKV